MFRLIEVSDQISKICVNCTSSNTRITTLLTNAMSLQGRFYFDQYETLCLFNVFNKIKVWLALQLPLVQAYNDFKS